MDRRTLMSALAGMAWASYLPERVHAQTTQPYPSQLIRWVVPYPAGGGSDTKARVVADSLRKGLLQQVVVENRPGASTNIAAELVARAAPDGYTIMTADNAILAFNEHLFPQLRYSPANDFSYIGTLGRFPLALVLSHKLPLASFNSFVAYVSRHPNELAYASAGNGSPHHLAMELFKHRTGLQLRHIPYQGAAPAMLDLMSGQVSAMFLDLASGLALLKANKVHALAIASAQRYPVLPDLPTFHERNMPEMEVWAFQGVLGPAGIPEHIVYRLNDELRRALQQHDVARRFEEFGFEPLSLSPTAFKELARAESLRWGKVIREMQLSVS